MPVQGALLSKPGYSTEALRLEIPHCFYNEIVVLQNSGAVGMVAKKIMRNITRRRRVFLRGLGAFAETAASALFVG